MGGSSDNGFVAAIVNPVATVATLASGGWQYLSGEKARKEAKEEQKKQKAAMDAQMANLKAQEDANRLAKNRTQMVSLARRRSLLSGGKARTGISTSPLGLPGQATGTQKTATGQ